jgi:hypothetical protein
MRVAGPPWLMGRTVTLSFNHQQFSFWQNCHVGAASEPRKVVARCHSHSNSTLNPLHNENCCLTTRPLDFSTTRLIRRLVGAASEPRKVVARCHSHSNSTLNPLHNENCCLTTRLLDFSTTRPIHQFQLSHSLNTAAAILSRGWTLSTPPSLMASCGMPKTTDVASSWAMV